MKQKALTWMKDAQSFYCLICDGSEPPGTHEHLPWGIPTLPFEPAMNVAGRTSDHPFKDLRAASRRAKRYPERIKSGNKRRRRDPMPVTRTQRNKEEAYKRIASREWEDDWDAERCHEIDLEHMDDIVEYERFGKHADIFERNDGEFVVYGENFGTWARRRIDEMRWVKEHRIHKSDKPTSDLRGTLVLPHTLRCTARPGGVMASIPTAPLARRTDTTLPTSMEDIRAHLALACVLASSKAFRHHCRRARTPSFQAIEGFGWWGEYTWAWHRNLSGCWVLGYGECDGCSVPCTCCCTGNGSMYHPCYCKDFDVGTPFEEPAPEEQQRCSLVEWVSGELKEKMEEDENALQEHMARALEQEAETQRRIEEHEDSWEANFGGDEWEFEWGHTWEEEYVVLDRDGSECDRWSAVQDGSELEVPVAWR
jgi:hypothetical protein